MKSAEAGEAAVAEFLRRLEHPLKAEIEALRRVLLAADPAVREGIKWNAPSFRRRSYPDSPRRTTGREPHREEEPMTVSSRTRDTTLETPPATRHSPPA